ncbi:polymorphic toxin-type HINT domain-containing protein [Pseudoalteromonas carrageenovora]|uniref:Uncharacterized protein n=1 Tax=Pseudoalteromonas carrageenovora IAM 12662 TaxID=1314868 RepID=A0A2K4XAU9_PSEVC|nr:polymorphic toxin-type HINT domain-containing protein [Pseudoalteromonas carrageenovora]MBE0383914.1 hypothetical protein [Pseudoalteromonas carrageenovora IAM 12662]GEB72998.1 hypothetical protein PCA01_37080 [Pseudoalteromonas carrageenovora]SOU41434.1 protein of unknown function [Pseudoalteromonas carrageenovora IAM 12662]
MAADTFKDWHEETITFTVVDENGVEESITTTEEHPFYVDNLGWLAAGNVEVGTIVSGPKFKNDITIASIQVNEKPQYAYNFTVDIDHTYLLVKQICGYTMPVTFRRFPRLQQEEALLLPVTEILKEHTLGGN